MSRLLEILGRGITVDTADLIWHWLGATEFSDSQAGPAQTEQLDKVTELMSAKKTDAAEEQLRLYLFENPGCVRGRLAAAAICLYGNRLTEAIEELNSVYMRQPNNTMALYALGYCYERLDKESQAVEFYQDCLKFKNYLQLPRQRLAAIYFKNGQVEKTIAEYEQLKSEYPEDLSTLVTLGHLYIAGACYREAIATFNTAILVHPDNFYAEDDEVNELVAGGELHEALERLDDLLGSDPERADLLMKRADILSMLGATAESISQYEEALRIWPGFLEATIKLGTQYLQMRADDLAAQQFNKAVEINDEIVDSYIGLASAQKLAGYVSESLTTLSLAAAIQPNSSFLLAETAALQFSAGANGQASVQDEGNSREVIEAVIAAHKEQILLRPQNPDLHYRLGVLLTSVGQPDEAIRTFESAVEINPTYSRARSKLAVCLFETGRHDAALEHLTGPECLSKETLELHYKTALLYCNSIKFASSLINLEHHMENNFACADPTVNISVILQNLGLLDRTSVMWDSLAETTSQAMGGNSPEPID
ncbi:MAG: tetratricopeptide repeat protein [Planctomycetota bacterium]|jgi:tetratricopeptide (TPR) repeat protein